VNSTLAEISQQLEEFKQTNAAQFQDLNHQVDIILSPEIKEVKTAVD
jgi:hypothetical protein